MAGRERTACGFTRRVSGNRIAPAGATRVGAAPAGGRGEVGQAVCQVRRARTGADERAPGAPRWRYSTVTDLARLRG